MAHAKKKMAKNASIDEAGERVFLSSSDTVNSVVMLVPNDE